MAENHRHVPLRFLAAAVLVVAVVGATSVLVSRRSKTAAPAAASAPSAPQATMYVYTGWAQSGHANTQSDVASELAGGRAGQTPGEVVNGSDPENCIACHAPTAVLANGGMTEPQTLGHFFTTAGGKFTANTVTADPTDWPNVACATCHDPRDVPSPTKLSLFDSRTGEYEAMSNVDQLCGQCHGNLRFPDTDHLSYNILQGTGGVGVRDWHSMSGIPCTGCHMFVSPAPGSNSAQLAGHTLAIDVQEPNGKVTSSCAQAQCHTNWTASQADAAIAAEKSEFQALDAIAQKSVAAATEAMKGVTNKTLQGKLAEAEHNLGYAESDESGGFHNHPYLMSLLKDANDKANEILSALGNPSA